MKNKVNKKPVLRKEHRFSGHVMFEKEWRSAIIILEPNLEFHIFMPVKDLAKKEIPKFIKGQLEDWDIKVDVGAVSVDYRPDSFNSLNGKIQFNEEEQNVFQKTDYKKLWAEIIMLPRICTFIKSRVSTYIPDEWGVTFYPEENNRTLFHLFNNNRNTGGLPNMFSMVDRSLYFTNNERWALDAIQERLKLLTSCLSFFTGCPVSYELLVGKYKKEVLCIQFKNESNPNAFVCPSEYNGHADIKENFLSNFSYELINKVETLVKNGKQEKIQILLLYFEILYMALYDEAKIALSFQLMESLAKYKKIKFGSSYKNKIIKNLSKKICPQCRNLIKQELKKEADNFVGYISNALKIIKNDSGFKTQPSSIKKIAEKYRNHVFHGGFFEDMTKIDNIVTYLPASYQDNLPVLFQAIVSIIGANFILGIDFDRMTAVKRRMH